MGTSNVLETLAVHQANSTVFTSLGTKLQAHRRAAIAFLVLMMAASGARLLTFQRFLPYNDHFDEPSMLLLARDWRGIEKISFIPDWLNGYPPLYIWINMGVQVLVEKLSTKPWLGFSDYTYWLRLLSALSGIVTTALVTWLGWELAGPIAGWFAGLLWAISPVIVEHNNLAIPDPFVYLTCAASLAMAFCAWRKRSPAWSFGSLLAGILAVYLKYPAVYILIPWGAVTLLLLRERPRHLWRWLAAEVALAAVSAGYLIFAYGALGLSNNEAGKIRGTGLAPMFDPARNLHNALFAIWPIGVIAFFAVLALGILAYAYSRRHQIPIVDWRKIVLLLLCGIAGIIITSSYFDLGPNLPSTETQVTNIAVRHVLPVTLVLCAICGAAIAQLARAFDAYRPGLKAPVLVGVGFAVFLPMLVGTVWNIHRFHLPDTRYLLWQWTDTNIPAEGRILMRQGGDVERTWNRYWSGYDGTKTFEWWWTDQDTFHHTPRQFFGQGIAYFAASDADLAKYFSTPEARAFIDRLTLLKTIPAGPDVAGPTIYFYRMVPPQASTTYIFGDQIALAGYDLSSDRPTPGEAIRFRPYWRIASHPQANYSMFVHLYPSGDTQLLAQYDGAPSTPTRLTLTWDDPNELYIGPDVTLAIPANLKPGEYHLAIGLYDFSTGQRLTANSGQDSLVIPITVRG